MQAISSMPRMRPRTCRRRKFHPSSKAASQPPRKSLHYREPDPDTCTPSVCSLRKSTAKGSEPADVLFPVWTVEPFLSDCDSSTCSSDDEAGDSRFFGDGYTNCSRVTSSSLVSGDQENQQDLQCPKLTPQQLKDDRNVGNKFDNGQRLRLWSDGHLDRYQNDNRRNEQFLSELSKCAGDKLTALSKEQRDVHNSENFEGCQSNRQEPQSRDSQATSAQPALSGNCVSRVAPWAPLSGYEAGRDAGGPAAYSSNRCMSARPAQWQPVAQTAPQAGHQQPELQCGQAARMNLQQQPNTWCQLQANPIGCRAHGSSAGCCMSRTFANQFNGECWTNSHNALPQVMELEAPASIRNAWRVLQSHGEIGPPRAHHQHTMLDPAFGFGSWNLSLGNGLDYWSGDGEDRCRGPVGFDADGVLVGRLDSAEVLVGCGHWGLEMPPDNEYDFI